MLKNKPHSYFKRKKKISVEIHICVFFKRKLLAEYSFQTAYSDLKPMLML